MFGHRLQKTWRTGRAVGSDFSSMIKGKGAGDTKRRELGGGWSPGMRGEGSVLNVTEG